LLACVVWVGAGCGSSDGGEGLQTVDPSFDIAEGASWTMQLSGGVSGEVSGSSVLWRSGEPDRLNLSAIDGGEQTSIDLYVSVSDQQTGNVGTVRQTTMTRGGTQYSTEETVAVTIAEHTSQGVRGAFRGTLTMRGSGESTQMLNDPIEVVGRFDTTAGQ
jgi:hypothetical protein